MIYPHVSDSDSETNDAFNRPGFGRFFDPTRIEMKSGGILTINYESCDALTLHYQDESAGIRPPEGILQYRREHQRTQSSCDL